MRAVLVMFLLVACHKKDVPTDEPAQPPRVSEPTKPPEPKPVTPSIDTAWIDRCLGEPTRPVLEYKNTERAVVAAGYRCIVALVEHGDLANARALDALLAPRLAHADAMPD